MSSRPIALKSSSARWVAPPAPAEAPFSLPGRARASASSSITVFAGRSGRTTSSIGLMPTGATATKSVRISYGMLRLSAGATVVEPLDASMNTEPSGALGSEAGRDLAIGAGLVLDHDGAPSRSPMPGAIRRVSRSLGPPGGKPTMKRSGRSGKWGAGKSGAWARVDVHGDRAGRAARPARTPRRRGLLVREVC